MLAGSGLLAACNVFADPGPSCGTTQDCDEGFVCHAEGKFCERDTGPIVLGYLAPNETQFATQFVETERAVALAIERVNAAGGVLNRKLAFRSMSDRPTELAVKNAGLFADERVAGIVGPTSSTPALAMQPLLNDRRIVAISPGATAPELGGTVAERFFFRTVGTPRHGEALAMALYAKKAEAGPRCDKAVLLQADGAYFKGYAAGFEETYGKLGGCITGKIPLPVTVQASYAGILDEVETSGATCALVMGPVEVYAPLFREIGTRSFSRPIAWLSSSSIHQVSFLEKKNVEGDRHVAEGMILSDWDSDPETPEGRWFKALYNQRYGHAEKRPLHGNVATTFDATVLLALAIERAGTASDRTAIRDALWNIVRRSDAHAVRGPQQLDTALADLRHRRELGCSEGFLSIPCEVHYRGASSDLELDESGTASPPSALYRVKGSSFEVVQRFDGADYDRFEESPPQMARCQ